MSDDASRFDSSRPHDSLFKHTFSQREHAESELRCVLPPEVIALLDFSTLTVMSGEFRDPSQSDAQSDLLLRLTLAGEEAYVYVLFEHQSTRDPWLPLRLLSYMCRVFERVKRDEKGRAVLPPVIPVVLYHGEGRWQPELRFADIYALPLGVRSQLSPHLLDFSARVDDLTAQTTSALATRAQANAFVRLVLLALQRARFAEDLLSDLESWLDVLLAVEADPRYAEDSASVFWYLYKVTEVPPAHVRALLERERATRLREMAVTTAEKLHQQGRQEGRLEGRQEGRLEGRQEGRLEGILEGATRAKRELLRRQIVVRFGEVSAAVAARLDAAQEPELDVWAERVLTAASAEDVVADQ